MDEAKLREKLARIEALFGGATTDGERVAAGEARRRIEARLQSLAQESPAVEYRLGTQDVWSSLVLIALLRRYGLEPYRYRGQRRTTVMVKIPGPFLDETLWPAYQEIEEALRTHLLEVTQRIIAEMIDADSSAALEKPAPARLGSGASKGDGG